MICNVVEGFLAPLVTYNEHCMSLLVVGVGDCSESFLASCVPLKNVNKGVVEGWDNYDLEFEHFVIDLEQLEFLIRCKGWFCDVKLTKSTPMVL